MSQECTLSTIPLSCLDLNPVRPGGTATDVVSDAIVLARHAESLGMLRYWVGEHHLNPVLGSTSPMMLLSHLAARTEHIRLGVAATLVAYHPPLRLAEDATLLSALSGGRTDLGLGRSVAARTPRTVGFDHDRPHVEARLLERGLGTFSGRCDQLLRLLAGKEPGLQGTPVDLLDAVTPQVWVHAAGAGESAEYAARNGLPMGVAYFSRPTTVLEAIDLYRERFVPGPYRDRPHVAIAVSALAADTEDEAAALGSGYDVWLRGLALDAGAHHYPTADERAGLPPLDPDEQVALDDRLRTRVVGRADAVASRLAAIVEAAEADELVVETVAPTLDDRLRSYELIARAWARI
ncbi:MULTISPECIES: MsnO8 family LLM class oxidoreductase [Pseudonocardia]|uniref:MsnO8 family LLM class oxidoreductase n=1 Tax=Pseudonocardia TaxID=1847 RepID=UPI001AD752FA|nr:MULTISPECIES: MsnO8 family LLM class oxidoreductase [Pseudonocardia]MBO4238024.1 MsnO8 family LLM class oxidoreductase [Pseudonocardia alni]